MVLNYGTNEDWRWHNDTVEFAVHREVGTPIRCRISRECIKDNLGNPESPEGMLGAARAAFDKITDIAGRLIAIGRFEPDGSVLIRTADWR